jgi:hypothetical protein
MHPKLEVNHLYCPTPLSGYRVNPGFCCNHTNQIESWNPSKNPKDTSNFSQTLNSSRSRYLERNSRMRRWILDGTTVYDRPVKNGCLEYGSIYMRSRVFEATDHSTCPNFPF